MRNRIYQNLPNVASIMGIIPLGLLLLPDGFRFLIPVIIFNNFMDDLDGVLASRLNLKSDFGAILDNVCDVVSHTIFVLLIGVYFGAPSSVAAVVAAISMILRISLRLKIPPLPSRVLQPMNWFVIFYFCFYFRSCLCSTVLCWCASSVLSMGSPCWPHLKCRTSYEAGPVLPEQLRWSTLPY